jgi:hypothetical protein
LVYIGFNLQGGSNDLQFAECEEIKLASKSMTSMSICEVDEWEGEKAVDGELGVF